MLQLEKKTLPYRGHSFELVCNNAALDMLQSLYGGSMEDVMADTVNRVSERLLLIMLNRAAQKQGLELFTLDDIQEDFSYAMILEIDPFGMLLRALSPAAAYAKIKEAAASDAGNPPAGQAPASLTSPST